MEPLEERRMLLAGGGIVANIGDAYAFEGNGGTSFSATFTVTLSGDNVTGATVVWATSDGSAVAGVDYTKSAGTVTFAAGVYSATLSVPIIGNLLPQPDRVFYVNLLRSNNAGIGHNIGVGHIIDDDPPTVNIVAATPTAVESKATAGVFRITRTGPADSALRVFYAIQGTAKNILDYSRIEKSVLIPTNRTSVDISIKPVQDNINDEPKTAVLVLKRRPEYKRDRSYFATVNIVQGDATAPTAQLKAAELTVGGSQFYQFTVKYTDDQQMDLGSVMDGSLQVTGPNKYSPLAELLAKSLSRNRRTVTAIYRVKAPNGVAWNAGANGTYTVKVLANQVKDASGNAMAAGTAGTFKVNIGG